MTKKTGGLMISRTEAVALINKRLHEHGKDEIVGEPINLYHYGKVELRELMDLLYGGPPTCIEETIRTGRF